VTWVRATAAQSNTPRVSAGIASTWASQTAGLGDRPVLPRPSVPAIEAPPAPPVDPCSLDPVPEATDRPIREAFTGPAKSYSVALSFDDGPSRENTLRVLDILERYEIDATFFVLGNRAERMGDILQKIDEGGHELANHGYSHASLKSLFPSQIRDELCKTQAAVESATGHRPALLRPPFGKVPEKSKGTVGALGYNFVLWDVDAEDWRFDDPAEMAAHVVDSVHSGSIILLHDRESITVHALPAIIEGLQKRGLQIVPVSKLTSLPAYQ
jgi:peptidoglycan/xylan/chitin deacetylase (PgdA/CDA1 family)